MKRSSDGNSSVGSSGMSKKMRADGISLRFLLQSKHAGGIIGKGGQTIKRLRSEYNATVNVPDSQTAERVLCVQASMDNAIKVLCECLPLCQEPPYSLQAGGSSGLKKYECEINLLVHSSQIGAVIGRGGFKIKELREKTHAELKAFPECLPKSTERVLAIAGGESEIEACMREILAILQDQEIKGPVHYYDPSMDPSEFVFADYSSPATVGGGGRGAGRGSGRGTGRGGFHGGSFGRGGGSSYSSDGGFSFGYGSGRVTGQGGGSYGSSGGGVGSGGVGGPAGAYDLPGSGGANAGGDFSNTADVSTSQVTIPKDMAGAIIGRGGERIRNIRQRSGADIKIDEAKPESKERLITITGEPSQIQYAQFLMQQSVRTYSGTQR